MRKTETKGGDIWELPFKALLLREYMVLISGLRILFKSAGGRSSGQYGAKEDGWLPSSPKRLKSPPACTSKSLLINMLYLVFLISGRNTSVKCQVAVWTGSHVPDSPGQELPVVFRRSPWKLHSEEKVTLWAWCASPHGGPPELFLDAQVCFGLL